MSFCHYAKEDESSPMERHAKQMSFFQPINCVEKRFNGLSIQLFRPLQMASTVAPVFPPISMSIVRHQGLTLFSQNFIAQNTWVTYFNGTAKRGMPTIEDQRWNLFTADWEKLLLRRLMDCNLYKESFHLYIKGHDTLEDLLKAGKYGGFGQLLQTTSMQGKPNLDLRLWFFTTAGVIKTPVKFQSAMNKGYQLSVASGEPLEERTVYVLPYFVANKDIEPGTPLTTAHKFDHNMSLSTTEFLSHAYYGNSIEKEAYYFKILPFDCTDENVYKDGVYEVTGSLYKKSDITLMSFENWEQLARIKREEHRIGSQNEEETSTTMEEEDDSIVAVEFHTLHVVYAHEKDRIKAGIFGDGEGQLRSVNRGVCQLTTQITLAYDGADDTSDTDHVHDSASSPMASSASDYDDEATKIYKKDGFDFSQQ